MGFTLRFMLGLFLVLAICSTSKGASTWRRMKLLSQELSTLEPVDKNEQAVNTSSKNEEDEQKPKTDETNKIVSEISNKEDVEPVEHKLDKPLSVTENNDLSKESVESTKTIHPDLNINIDKYISPDFHDKNNVYRLPTSPDVEKYVDVGNDSNLKTTSSLDTTSNYDFDRKHQTIQNDIKKKLEYIDKEFPKSTQLYEETTDNETLLESDDIIKYKNVSFTGKNGNKVYHGEQVESGRIVDQGTSYNHTVLDEQKHLLSDEAVLDNKPINDTDDLRNKIFRPKTTTDPEVLHEKLNQTERRTALLSNKIEHDSTNDNHRLKWSFHYVPTTLPSTTSTGQKEEIIFVPYTKESPINISKRGSTKYIDTITTQKPVEYKNANALDGAAVENQIYPVHVPAPNKIPKEETAESASTTATIFPASTITPNSFNETSPLSISTTNGNVVITENEPITSNVIVRETTKLPDVATISQNFSLVTEKPEDENVTLGSEKNDETNITSSSTPRTDDVLQKNATIPVQVEATNITFSTSTPTVVIDEKENTTRNEFTALEANTTMSNTTPSVINEDHSTKATVTPENETTRSLVAQDLDNSTSLASANNDTSPINSTPPTTEETSTHGDYVSDQTTITVTTNETPLKNTTLIPSTTINQGVTEAAGTIVTSTIDTETTPFVYETSPSQLSTVPDHKTSTKLDDLNTTTTLKMENRTGGSRELKNLTTIPDHSTIDKGTSPSVETTTADYRINVIKQGDIITSTTKHFRKDIPATVYTQKPPVDRKSYPVLSQSSELSTVGEDTTEGGYSDSAEQEEGISGGKIAAIVISCIGAVCFIILAILLFVMRKRHKRFNYGQRCTPVSLDAYSVDNVSAHNSVRRKGMMRASKRSYGNPAFDESSVTHLLNFPELMKFGANNEGIASEYNDIPQISVQTNELPEGCETKNRYANVIPLPESRVYLSTTDECPNSDYINANFVMGPKSTKNYYIACQAPMQSTVDDFWRMIWEQQSRVILMLTHLFENGSEKCFDYLPPSEVLDCHRLFGDFQITLKKREVKEKYVISNLQLKNMVSNTWREVTQLWYLGWPERGVPAEESSLVAFLLEARSFVKATPSENGKLKDSATQGSNIPTQSEHNPIVVHCSPGTGRTGTVIACDIAIREFELSRQVDIPKTVYQIRRTRAGAVQTKEQYAFIYRVITWYANKLTGGVLDSV